MENQEFYRGMMFYYILSSKKYDDPFTYCLLSYLVYHNYIEIMNIIVLKNVKNGYMMQYLFFSIFMELYKYYKLLYSMYIVFLIYVYFNDIKYMFCAQSIITPPH